MTIRSTFGRLRQTLRQRFQRIPTILKGPEPPKKLVEYYRAQLKGSMGLIDKNAAFRYEVFGEELQKGGYLLTIDRMLCVGCRNAYELDYFESLGINEVVGIDLFTVDPRIQVMDMHQMQFEDSTFDALYAGDSFEHAYDLHRTAGEFVRVVKPGGLIMLAVPANSRTDEVDRWSFTDFASVYHYFGESVGVVLFEREKNDEKGNVRALNIIFEAAAKLNYSPS